MAVAEVAPARSGRPLEPRGGRPLETEELSSQEASQRLQQATGRRTPEDREAVAALHQLKHLRPREDTAALHTGEGTIARMVYTYSVIRSQPC